MNSSNAVSFTRTLRLKVKAEAYPWLNLAAIEVNRVWNYCNESSDSLVPPSAALETPLRETGTETARMAA